MVLSMPSRCLSMHRESASEVCTYLDLPQKSHRGESGDFPAAEEGEWENKELMSIHILSSFGWSSLDNGKEKGRNKQTTKQITTPRNQPCKILSGCRTGYQPNFGLEIHDISAPKLIAPLRSYRKIFKATISPTTLKATLAILFLALPPPREVPTPGTAVDGRHYQNISSALCLLRPLPSSFSANSSLVALPNLSGNSSFTVAPFPLIVMPWPSPPPFPLPLAPCLFAKPRMLTPSPPDGGMDVVDVGRAVIRSASFAVCESLLSEKIRSVHYQVVPVERCWGAG